MPDPTTQSNYLSIITKHVSFDWTVDFDKKLIYGSATHTLLVQDTVVKEAVFDTGDLVIHSAEVDGEKASFILNEKHEVMGSALHVAFARPIAQGTNVTVKITYETSDKAVALQFLDKELRESSFRTFSANVNPYMRGRSHLYKANTPSVKLTYDAKVKSVLPALMSAIRVSPPSDGPAHDGKVIGKDYVTYEYNQPTSIPSYLIAIACGDVRFKPFPKVDGKDWTTGIWAEPEFIEAAYWEFSEDTGRFLAAEEEVVSPYRFGVYDLLVLPPSFPYGGMENACLTFLTPTLITGDRTLVDVVVHELTHSWFGNGVTHTDASHFWLNEGWTTYMERVLQEKLHTPAHRGFSYLIGSKALLDALKQYEDRPKYQRLIIDFDIGENPDDAYSSVPYEKGANFLLHLENTLGGLDVFLPYVRDYVNTFMGKSINTDTWKTHLYDYWRQHGGEEKIKALDGINWDAWFYGEGLKLPVDMNYDLSLAKQAYDLANRWDTSRGHNVDSLDFKSTDLDSFDSNQKAVFLERLQSFPALPPKHVNYLGELYSLSTTGNAELRFRYYQLALLDPSTPESKEIAHKAVDWVVGNGGTGVVKGRMKFCRPVLRDANKPDPEYTKATYTKYKSSFHPIAQNLIDKDLGLA